MMKLSLSPLVAVLLLNHLDLIQSFQPYLSRLHLPKNTISIIQSKYSASKQHKRLAKQNEEEEKDDRTGMNDAFKSLDALSSLDFGNDKKATTTNLKADEQILKDINSSSGGSSDDQEEVKLYTEMVEELESDGEDGIYENIMGDMKDSSSLSSSSSSSPAPSVLSDADGIGSVLGQDENEETLIAVEISQNTDEFMKRALEEAMDEVKLKSNNENNDGKNAKLPKGILDDAEMMKEINAIFDKANEKILDSVAEMKAEQAALSEESANARKEALKGEEERLAEAQGSVSRLLGKVKEETLEVEKAMVDLQQAQEKLLDDPLMKAADMRSGGIVKTASLAGALLFSFRSVGELILLAGSNGADHGIAAAIQAVIAIACAAYFFFA